MSLHLTFKPSGAAIFELDFEPSNTIGEVKQKCESSCGIDKEQQKIIFKGRILKDEETLAQHGVQSGNVLHLVKGAKPGQPTDTPAATTTTQPAAAPAAQHAAQPHSVSPAVQPQAAPGAGAQNMANMFGQMPQGMSGMGGMGGMGMDPQMMSQLMQTPMFQQMMTAMSQNPQMMTQMMQMNPMVQQMAQQNPQVAMLLQNPQLMAQLMNPQTMQAMMQMQQVMGSLQAAHAGAPVPGGQQPDYASMMAAMQNNPMFAEMVAGGGGMGGGAAMPLPPAALAEFEQRYSGEIAQLEAMGFTDRAANIEALRVCDGNVELAINYLFDLTSNM